MIGDLTDSPLFLPFQSKPLRRNFPSLVPLPMIITLPLSRGFPFERGGEGQWSLLAPSSADELVFPLFPQKAPPSLF